MSDILRIYYPSDFFGLRGYFSIMSSVLRGLLIADEKRYIPRIELAPPLYCDPDKNLWDMTYKQWGYSASDNVINNTDTTHVSVMLMNYEELCSLRPIWKKYAILKPEVQSQYNEIKNRIIKGKTLGIHCRGLDKNIECKLHSPEVWEEYMKQELSKNKYDQVLLCTDDLKYYNYFYNIREKYNIVFTDAFKADPKYESVFSNKCGIQLDNMKKVTDVLFDCYLLSECDYLIKNHSNVSSFAVFVNDKVKGFTNMPFELGNGRWGSYIPS